MLRERKSLNEHRAFGEFPINWCSRDACRFSLDATVAGQCDQALGHRPVGPTGRRHDIGDYSRRRLVFARRGKQTCFA